MVALDYKLVATRLLHPLQVELLDLFGGNPEIAWSPKGLSEVTGEPLGNVSYHVRVLLRCRLIRLKRTRPVRGATQHFYVLRKEVLR